MALTLASTVKLSSGHAMPQLGFGSYQNPITRETCVQAFNAGYRHVDSAQLYQNEEGVGQAVREVLETGRLRREDLFITTKCHSRDHGYESTLAGVESSLKKFGFEYIDLFLVHDPQSGKEKRLATYKALLECKAAGKIRDVGVSNYGIRHLEEISEVGMEMPSVNQIEIHPLCQQRPIVGWCIQRSIVIEAYCPLLQGALDQPVFVALAAKHTRSVAQVLLRWSLQKGFVPLPKSVTPERIVANAQLFDFALDEEDMKKLDALDKGADGAVSWNPVDFL